jgi:hypothetical protein
MAGVLAAGLALGLVVAPVVGGGIASAQTQPSSTTQAGPGDALRTAFLDNLAKALGIQRSALDSAITSAGTSTVDSAQQQGTLTQQQADDLKARIQAGDAGALFGGRGPGGRGPGGPGGPEHGLRAAGVQQAMVDAAASKLGVTAAELKTQLRSGQTIAQLAQAHGTTEQAVIDAALVAAKTQLAQLVSNSTLTQAQADQIYAQLQQRGANRFARPERGPGGRPGNAAPVSPTPTTGQGA